MPELPSDYVERVYAGVLGKLVGVYIGRPYEGWTFDEITSNIGHVTYYVHDHPLFNDPLVITDDDISGTFQFVRALEEHSASGKDISAEEIGKTWLNNTIEHRTVFWWGGRGMSTEHTAWLNLKDGIKAPHSGSIETNGKTVAEQIGAQIFIDGWALVSPGNPAQAAMLAGRAGSVSHDGESVYAAQLWAAMEAEAFNTKDVDRLIDVGLSFIPKDSLIASMIGQVRSWAKEDKDWLVTRQRIQDNYGYDKFHGACHVVPNHAIMIMSLIYGGHSFDEAIHIINTCGWDTDCNSGNVACLVAIMHGIEGLVSGEKDWLGPLADRALISSADNGYSINNGARIALDLVNMGRRLAGKDSLTPPKDGAQYHFTLPHSVQGFQSHSPDDVTVKQDTDSDGFGPALKVDVKGLRDAKAYVGTDTFSSPEVRRMRTYELMASPLVYPGQTISAKLKKDPKAQGTVSVNLALQVYTANDDLIPVNGLSVLLDSTDAKTLSWTIPDDMDAQPIQNIGITLSGTSFKGTIWLDHLRWDGSPSTILRRPSKQPCEFWHRAWVNGATVFKNFMMPRGFVVSQSYGEGIISCGTRDWSDYRLTVPGFRVNLGKACGVAVRVQGLNRYYGVMLDGNKKVKLVKAIDGERIELARVDLAWEYDEMIDMEVEVRGEEIRAKVKDVELMAKDGQFANGGVGLVVTQGTASADQFEIRPLS